MSREKKRRRSLESAPTPCDDTDNRAVSKRFKPPEDNTDGRSQQNSRVLLLLGTKHASAMCEYLQQNKGMTLSDKQVLCLLNSQTMRSSVTLGRASTSSAGALSPFWSESRVETSRRLPLPPEIGSVGLPSSSSSGISSSTMSKSWFSTKTINPPSASFQRTCLTSSKCFVAGEMGAGNIKSMETRRTIKIKIKPSRDQKSKLQKFASHARYTYNEAVIRLLVNPKLSKYDLRDSVVTKKSRDGKVNAFFDDKEWLLDTPKAIRQQAVFEAKKNQKSAISNKSAGHIKTFDLKSKKTEGGSWTIGVERSVAFDHDERKVNVLPNSGIGSMGLYRHKKLPRDAKPSADCFIHRDNCGRYYILTSIAITTTASSATKDRPMAAIDPGLRKFATVYSSDGACHGIGVRCERRMWAVLKHLDSIQDEMRRTHGEEKQRLRKKKLRLYEDMRNLQEELHHKAAKWLTDNFSAVVVPQFSAKQCTKRQERALRTKESRLLLSLGHSKFRMVLQHKCAEAGVHFVLCDERYTTKTCTRCLYLNTPGASETYTCSHCGFVCDRDANAARNILLKNLEVFHVFDT